jgi:hypothetical protein
VGQTINTIQNRAREHWYGRSQAKDHLHLTLADDPDPMCLVFLPLECIPKEEWAEPTPRQPDWRARERTRFRAVATPRERYWVDRLHSMWPRGWNSQYPGKPMAPHHRTPPSAAPEPQPARDLQAVQEAVRMWSQDPRATQRWLAGAAREDLVELLEGLEKNLRPAERTQVTAALATEVRDVLRRRKAERKPRDYVRFLYGNRLAASLRLPDLFHDPQVYKLHPEPDVAAAIMVVHRFAPQVAADLFNYSTWAANPAPMDGADPTKCPCHGQVFPGTPLLDGHVLGTDPACLRSPYLRDILLKGKKYRLQQPLGSVLPRLRDGLDQYIAYKVRAKQGDQGYADALGRWAHAVMAAARTRLVQAAIDSAPEPDG